MKKVKLQIEIKHRSLNFKIKTTTTSTASKFSYFSALFTMPKYAVDVKFMALDRVSVLSQSMSQSLAIAIVAQEVGCSVRSIYKWLKKKRTTGVLTHLKGGGRHACTTLAQDHAMLANARANPDKPFREIARENAPNVSVSTVRRRLKTWRIGRYVKRKKSAHTPLQLARRLAWCETHKNKPESFWRKVVCMDEFACTSDSVGREWVSRPRGDPGNPSFTVKSKYVNHNRKFRCKYLAVCVPYYNFFKLYPCPNHFGTEIFLLMCMEVRNDLNALFPEDESYYVTMDHHTSHIAVRNMIAQLDGWERWLDLKFPAKSQDIHIIGE